MTQPVRLPVSSHCPCPPSLLPRLVPDQLPCPHDATWTASSLCAQVMFCVFWKNHSSRHHSGNLRLRAQASIKRGGFDIRDFVLHSPGGLPGSHSCGTAALCNSLWSTPTTTRTTLTWPQLSHRSTTTQLGARTAQHAPRASYPRTPLQVGPDRPSHCVRVTRSRSSGWYGRPRLTSLRLGLRHPNGLGWQDRPRSTSPRARAHIAPRAAQVTSESFLVTVP